jgi:hypothetical protein
MTTTQGELFRARGEDDRPKAVVPAKVTVTERTASPPEPPKRRKRVAGHDPDASYLQPAGNGGRVMVLDGLTVAVRLEDPFHDKGEYLIEMDLDSWARADWTAADPDYVSAEHDRLSVVGPDQAEARRRCAPAHLSGQYEAMLVAARDKIDAELGRLKEAE